MKELFIKEIIKLEKTIIHQCLFFINSFPRFKKIVVWVLKKSPKVRKRLIDKLIYRPTESVGRGEHTIKFKELTVDSRAIYLALKTEIEQQKRETNANSN